MRPVVTITTDFGGRDSFLAAMKGVLLSRCPGVQLVDLCYEVPPQNVRVGALRLASAAPYFPPGAVHLVVIDPGVGGPRRPIAVVAGGSAFVGPDNGVLSLAARRDLLGWRAVELTNSSYWLPEKSGTFHGRDIFAPVAAHLASGGGLAELGNPVDSIVELSLPEVSVASDQLSGAVLDVDRFGNLITNIRPRDFAGRVPDLIEVAGAEIPGLSTSYDPRFALVAVINSDGWLELAAPGRDASTLLGVTVDAPVRVRLR